MKNTLSSEHFMPSRREIDTIENPEQNVFASVMTLNNELTLKAAVFKLQTWNIRV